MIFFQFFYFFRRKRSHFIFLDSRINFSICCENCHVCLAGHLEKKGRPFVLENVSGGHLEKISRPVVLENVSGGHFEKKRKKRLLLPSFQRGRTLNMFFFYFALCNSGQTQNALKQRTQTVKTRAGAWRLETIRQAP